MALSDFLWLPYQRWRHYKGYGVHSPFAYQMVNDVVNPGNYGYYVYSEIKKSLKKETSFDELHKESDLKLIARLAISLGCNRIIALGFQSLLLRRLTLALKKKYESCKTISFLRKPASDLVVITGSSVSSLEIDKMMEAGIAVISFNPDFELRNELEKERQNGLVFTGKNIIIAIPRREMAFVSYAMKF